MIQNDARQLCMTSCRIDCSAAPWWGLSQRGTMPAAGELGPPFCMLSSARRLRYFTDTVSSVRRDT